MGRIRRVDVGGMVYRAPKRLLTPFSGTGGLFREVHFRLIAGSYGHRGCARGFFLRCRATVELLPGRSGKR
jgi:hypothetical protein